MKTTRNESRRLVNAGVLAATLLLLSNTVSLAAVTPAPSHTQGVQTTRVVRPGSDSHGSSATFVRRENPLTSSGPSARAARKIRSTDAAAARESIENVTLVGNTTSSNDSSTSKSASTSTSKSGDSASSKETKKEKREKAAAKLKKLLASLPDVGQRLEKVIERYWNEWTKGQDTLTLHRIGELLKNPDIKGEQAAILGTRADYYYMGGTSNQPFSKSQLIGMCQNPSLWFRRDTSFTYIGNWGITWRNYRALVGCNKDDFHFRGKVKGTTQYGLFSHPTNRAWRQPACQQATSPRSDMPLSTG